MSNSVHTWEDEVTLTGEIELTDAQLEGVCGAWDDDNHEHHSDDDPHHHHHHHFHFFKKEKEVFFEKEKVSKASDSDW